MRIRNYTGATIGAIATTGLIYGTCGFFGIDPLEETFYPLTLAFGPTILWGTCLGYEWQRHTEFYQNRRLGNNREPQE